MRRRRSLRTCLGYPRSSMCSGGGEDQPAPARRQGHTDHRPPRVTPRGNRRRRARPPSPPFRNVDAPPAAVRPPSSPPCSVYHSLSIVPVGAVPPRGGHGPPARPSLFYDVRLHPQRSNLAAQGAQLLPLVRRQRPCRTAASVDLPPAVPSCGARSPSDPVPAPPR